jgi:hypothetical protein
MERIRPVPNNQWLYPFGRGKRPLAWGPITGTDVNVSGSNNIGVTPATVLASATTSVTSQIVHYAVGRTDKMKFVFPVWGGVATNGEASQTNGGTITASVVIDGTPHQITFDGGATSKAYAGSDLAIVSDEITLPRRIHRGDKFHTRTCFTVALGTDKIPGAIRTLSGAASEGAEARYSALEEGAMAGDQTMLGTAFTKAGAFSTYSPVPLGYGRFQTAGIAGDSIDAGSGGTGIRQSTGGPAVRALMGHDYSVSYDPTIVAPYGFVNVARSGESAYQAVGSQFDKRIDFLQKCGIRTVLCNYLTNDINAGKTEAETKANMVALVLRLYNAGVERVVYQTMPPNSTSSDSWTTVAGQTATNATNRRVYTDWMLDGGFEEACIAAGVPNGVLQVWHQAREIQCDKDGSNNTVADDRGPLWDPTLGVLKTGAVTTATSSSQFTDNVAIPTVGAYRGYAVRYTSGTRANESQPIRYHSSAGVFNTLAFTGAPAVGNTYEIQQTMTVDGAHPSDVASMLMARTFDRRWVL